MNTVEIMTNYCSALREKVFNQYLLDFLNKFLKWLDGMANTQPKYYNIVMLENLHHILRRIDPQLKWEEWANKRNELDDQYRTNVATYVKYIFEYQNPKYAAYMAKVNGHIKTGEFASLTQQSEFSLKEFDRWVKSAFGSVSILNPHI
ncbi:MAG: hypothetical protein P4M11_07070 [Candidatus Pacebacteria bacterium]|nr:hypothetical protein [Candidatus Paceibacterota bacterium]